MRPGGKLKPTTVLHSSVLKNRGRIAPAPHFSVRVALGAIRGYQILIRPLLNGSCRYLPTCSEYACGAIDRFGIVKGSGLALWRLLRCHPFHPGGYDPLHDPKAQGARDS